MFCEVERSYIEDGFNLYGLRACVANFSDCLDLILDRIGPDDSDDSHLTQSACTLYGLIHARYIITAHGLDAMYNKYAGKEFGTCPLIQCNGQPVLPVGLKDEMGADTVKIFCPKCQCVYHPPPLRSRGGHHGTSSGTAGSGGGSSGAVDGAAFGTTFPHLFLMTFNNLVPDPLPSDSTYIPRVFGFRVHQSARQRTPAPNNGAINHFAALPSSQAQNNSVGRRIAGPPTSGIDTLDPSNGEGVVIRTSQVDSANKTAETVQGVVSMDVADQTRDAAQAADRDDDDDEKMPPVGSASGGGDGQIRATEGPPSKMTGDVDRGETAETSQSSKKIGSSAARERDDDTARRQKRRSGTVLDDDAPDEDDDEDDDEGAESSKRSKRRSVGAQHNSDESAKSNSNGAKTKRIKRGSGIGVT